MSMQIIDAQNDQLQYRSLMTQEFDVWLRTSIVAPLWVSFQAKGACANENIDDEVLVRVGNYIRSLVFEAYYRGYSGVEL